MSSHQLACRLGAAGIAGITLLAGSYFVVLGAPTGWPVYQHDFNRTALNPDEPQVKAISAGWSSQLDGTMFAQPLVAGDVVYAATENDTVYALDVNSGAVIWQQHFTTAARLTQVVGAVCDNIDPHGITGTPVIDTTNGVLYTAALQQSPNIHHELYALNLKAGGAVLYHYPIDAPGADPRYQGQRAALALGNGRVYVAYAGRAGDCGQYMGQLVGVRTGDATGASRIVYNPPTTWGGGIWAAPSMDGSGNLYVASGNSNATGSTPDRGESVTILSPTLAQLDYFTAPEWKDLNIQDLDIGSMGPVLLQNGWILQVGKNAMGYLLNTAHMGHVGGQLFEGQVCDPSEMGMGFAAYLPPSTVYVPCLSVLKAVHINTNGTPGFTVTNVRTGYLGVPVGWQGVSPPIIAGGVLWNLDPGHRLLLGFDANTGQSLFTQNLAGTPAHFAAPSAAAGHVFVPSGSILEAFTLSSGATPATYTTQASGSPNVVPGATYSITSTVTSSQLETDLIDVEVYDPSWTRVFQQNWDNQSFVGGQPRVFTSAWQVPATTVPGSYKITIGVFHQGWGTVKNWTTAGGVAVIPAFTSSGSMSPITVHPGGSVALAGLVKSASASTAVVDLEVWDSSWNKVFKQFWDTQSFTPGVSRSYVTSWAVPATLRSGTYTLTVGEFSPDWATNYNWIGAATVTVN